MIILIFVILIAVATFYIIQIDKNQEPFKMLYTNISGKSYNIQDVLPNPEKAADLIGYLDIFIDKFIVYLTDKYLNDARVKRLSSRLMDTKLEESPHKDNVSSYTINKGQLISICVRHKNENKDFHEYQTLLFVIIHELAHVATDTIGHDAKFVANFKWLLKSAKDSGLYHPEDYSKSNITYCGIKVTNNPMFS